MARPGPKPQPTNLRLLAGGRGAAESAEPQPTRPVEVPVPPPYLGGYAKAEWERVIEDLYSTGVYADIDQTMLSAYCMAFGRWLQASIDLEKMAALDPATHGAMLKTSNGNAIQNPLLGVVSSSGRDMARLAAEFGLTPSSRTLLDSGKGKDDDPIARRYGL